jgi:hypothetical protein
LTPSERVTLADSDSLPDSRVPHDESDAESKWPTTDAHAVLRLAAKTLKTTVHHAQATRSRRFALLLMSVAALAYTAFILVHARSRRVDRAETAAASAELAAKSDRVTSTPMAPSVAPSLEPAEANAAQDAAQSPGPGSEDHVVKVVAGDKLDSVKAAEAPASKPKRNRAAGKSPKAQGALRNLDF